MLVFSRLRPTGVAAALICSGLFQFHLSLRSAGTFLLLAFFFCTASGGSPTRSIQPGAQLSKSLPGLFDDPEPALLVYQHAVMGHLDAGEECTFLYLHGALLPSDEELILKCFAEWQQDPGVFGGVGEHLLGEIPRPVILLVALV